MAFFSSSNSKPGWPKKPASSAVVTARMTNSGSSATGARSPGSAGRPAVPVRGRPRRGEVGARRARRGATGQPVASRRGARRGRAPPRRSTPPERGAAQQSRRAASRPEGRGACGGTASAGGRAATAAAQSSVRPPYLEGEGRGRPEQDLAGGGDCRGAEQGGAAAGEPDSSPRRAVPLDSTRGGRAQGSDSGSGPIRSPARTSPSTSARIPRGRAREARRGLEVGGEGHGAARQRGGAAPERRRDGLGPEPVGAEGRAPAVLLARRGEGHAAAGPERDLGGEPRPGGAALEEEVGVEGAECVRAGRPRGGG